MSRNCSRIVAACRAALPPVVPTAKMRLGIRDAARPSTAHGRSPMAGAAEITVHARTKLDGYQPPARLGLDRPHPRAVAVNVIANGGSEPSRCRLVPSPFRLPRTHRCSGADVTRRGWR